MVHPDYRRRGIFTALLTAAKQESRATGAEKLLLICEDSSPSGRAFIAAIGAQLDSSEYDMVLQHFHESMHFDDRLFFRQVSRGDVDALAKIMAEDMDEPMEEVWPMAESFFQEPNCTTYIAMFGEAGLGCKEPVGCLRVYELEDEFGIYGFVVRPEYRRRGYGRQMLEETIRTLQARSQKRIMLEVDTENTKAINLYRSRGFEVRTTYGYYAVDIT
jgi:ribosomal protein S18 acetylase RimI-like enzyme